MQDILGHILSCSQLHFPNTPHQETIKVSSNISSPEVEAECILSAQVTVTTTKA